MVTFQNIQAHLTVVFDGKSMKADTGNKLNIKTTIKILEEW